MLLKQLAPIALVLALTGCAVSEPEPSVVAVDFEACFLTGVSTFEESTLNQALDISMHQAQVEFGIKIQVAELVSGAKSSVISRQARKFVTSGCNLVVSSGVGSQAAFESVAKANPEVDFLLLDAEATKDLELWDFDEWSAAFEAGYLAAMKASSTVGVWHQNQTGESANILDGFREGVDLFNVDNAAAVEVLVSKDLDALETADVVLATRELSAAELKDAVWLYLKMQPEQLLIDGVKTSLTGEFAGTAAKVGKAGGYFVFSTKALPSGAAGQISRLEKLFADGTIVGP
ncbi:MAG: hypothetical protein RL716_1004 [Actinomycetota bacterium]